MGHKKVLYILYQSEPLINCPQTQSTLTPASIPSVRIESF
jgi:hypothetical protein